MRPRNRYLHPSGSASDTELTARTAMRVYLEPQDRTLLHRLALECGYLAQTRKISVRMLSHFVLDILNLSCQFTCESHLLYRDHPSHIASNVIFLDIPYLLRTAIPTHFGLDSWDQVLANIARRNIRPIDGYPTIGSPQIIQERIERIDKEDPRTSRVGQGYKLYTDVTALHLREIFPVQQPTVYIDNRPDPLSEAGRSLALKGTDYSWQFCWYISELPRQARTLFIPDNQIQPLLDLAQHWYIYPLRSRKLEAKLCIAIEALAHNLLVLPPTDDTPQQQPDDNPVYT